MVVVVNAAVAPLAATMASVVAVAAVSMVVVVNVAEDLLVATMAMVVVAAIVGLVRVVALVAAIVGPPMVALTLEGSVAEVTAAVGAVSLSRPVHPSSKLLPSRRPALLPSRLVATLSRRAVTPS
jgi:hypothetical protein